MKMSLSTLADPTENSGGMAGSTIKRQSTILVVDDNPTNSKLLCNLLDVEGYRTLTAADGREAIQLLRREPVNAVVSDILMPNMDGYRLLYEIRRDDSLKPMPFIFYTSTYTAPADEKLALELSADRFLCKPAPACLILRAVSDLLNRSIPPERPQVVLPEDLGLIKEYSERLVAKLEDKTIELEQANNRTADALGALQMHVAELQQTKKQNAHLLSHSTAVVYSVRLEGRDLVPVSVSSNVRRLLGFEASEVLRPAWWQDHMVSGDRQQYLERIARIQTDQTATQEYCFQRKDRSVIWVRDVLRVLRDQDGHTELIGSWTDITDRKKSEQCLAVEHAVCQALSRSTSLADARGKLLEAVCEILDWAGGSLWTVDRVAGALRCAGFWRRPSTAGLTSPAISEELQCARGQGLAGRVWASGQRQATANFQGETEGAAASLPAELGICGAAAFPIWLGGEVQGVLEFFSDELADPDPGLWATMEMIAAQLGTFIERKQMEERLRQAQKMEAIGQLAGGIAHDFNNLLTVINGYSKLLVRTGKLSGTDAENLEEIYLAGESASKLTRQLLAFSRKQTLQIQRVDLNSIVTDVAKMLQRVIGEDILLEVRQSTAEAVVQADPSMIEQILMNLAVNARDAMPEGGRLTIETSATEILPESSKNQPRARPGKFVSLAVKDTGCGMSPDILAHIFEPFFTTKPPGQGTGLGLATVFGIVEQHGGWLDLETALNVGTTFTIFFPATVAASPGGPSLGESKPVVPVLDKPYPPTRRATTVRECLDTP